jgi:DNA (cytosine-5)-methyltransferase 1
MDNDKIVVRKLIPLEYWRLMDFDDEDFERARAAMNDLFYNGADKSSSQLYKQAGNSIVVAVLEKDIEQLRGKR